MKTPVHLGIGLEGISVGVTHLLPPGRRRSVSLRNHGQYLALTGETDAYFGELFGRVTGTGAEGRLDASVLAGARIPVDLRIIA